MLERQIESYLRREVEKIGGRAFKFISPGYAGVSDRIVCLPDGSTHFVEVKRPSGKLSPNQKQFEYVVKKLNQNYACLWSRDEVDKWIHDRWFDMNLKAYKEEEAKWNSDHTSTTPQTSSLAATEP